VAKITAGRKIEECITEESLKNRSCKLRGKANYLKKNLPEELVGMKQWIFWRAVEKDGKIAKIPCDKNGNPVDCNLTENQHSFEYVVERVKLSQKANTVLGIGFVFIGNGISGVDIDHCIDENGRLSEEAREVIEKFNSYTEISPSGNGVHIIVKGDLPESARENKKHLGGKKRNYEVYSSGRYFTITGDVYGEQSKLKIGKKKLLWFWERYIRRNSGVAIKEPEVWLDSETKPEKIIARIEETYDGEEFKSLMDGNVSEFNSQSEADLRLLVILAKHCQGNRWLMEKVFELSQLSKRRKWQRRKDYRERSIDKALEFVKSNLASPQVRKELKVYSAAELEKQTLPEMSWIIEGLLPEGLVIFGGKPKKGKSWLALKIALACARGKKFFGQEVREREVLYLGLEDGPRRLRDRLLKLAKGKDLPEKLLIADASQNETVCNGGVESIEAFLDSNESVKLVIIDVLGRIMPKQRRKETQYQYEYSYIASLQKICVERKICILAVVHTRKAEAEDPYDCISGTLGVTGASDTVWVLKSPNTNEVSGILHVTGRELMEKKLALKLVDGNWIKLSEPPEAYEVSNTRRKIISYLRIEGKGTPINISKALKIKAGTVRKLLGDMLKDHQVVKANHGLYSLPENT
jgi:hypothetical protein